jgi:hypothetical protein
MAVSELQEVAKERNTRYLWKIFDLRCVCAIHIFEDGVDDDKEEYARDLVSHEGQAGRIARTKPSR